MAKQVICGIYISDRVKKVPDVQKILTEYGCSIKTRLGLHEADDTVCSTSGLVILQMVGEECVCDEMRAKLEAIAGVQVKKMVFDEQSRAKRECAAIMVKTAQDIMTTEIITTGPTATVGEVATLLVTYHISGLPVVDDNCALVGMITEADLFGVPRSTGVRDLMTREVVTATPGMPVPEVAALLAQHRIKRVPVLDDAGQMVGIISRADVVAAIAAGYLAEGIMPAGDAG